MFAGCVTSSRCILRAGKPRTAVVCAGKHRGAFVENGWCITSIPLAKLLIEGGLSCRAAPPCLAVMEARAADQLKAACAALVTVSVTLGSVVCALSRMRLRAVPTLTQGFHQAPLQSPFTAQASSDVQETASGAASARLSAESERLTTWEGDTKSPPNHLLSSALWSNANLARNKVSGLRMGGLSQWDSTPVVWFCVVRRCLPQVRGRPQAGFGLWIWNDCSTISDVCVT